MKRDKRQVLRFSHKVGQGRLRVYTQVLFDVFVEKTDFHFPIKGSIPPSLDSLKQIPYGRTEDEELAHFSADAAASAFKEAIRRNHSEDRTVYVRKPHASEMGKECTLIDLGYARVLGLDAQKPGPEIIIKNPMVSVDVRKNRHDSHRLETGDTVILDYFSRSPIEGRNEYYEMLCQVTKMGIENVGIQPRRNAQQETGLPVEMLDFSMNGLRFENSRELMAYVFGNGEQPGTLAEQKERLVSTGFVFTFYP